MFVFIKKCFFTAIICFDYNVLKVNPSKCVSINNQQCKIRPQIINIKSNEPLFYPYSVKIGKSSGSCDNINDPYTRLCVPDVVKNINVKVFNLISRTNETRLIKCMKVVIVNVDQREVFVIINNIGIKINANVNVKI